MYDNARKLGSALTVWLVENWKAISCLVVIVEVTVLAVFLFQPGISYFKNRETY